MWRTSEQTSEQANKRTSEQAKPDCVEVETTIVELFEAMQLALIAS